MTAALRILLVVGSLLTLFYMMKRIRASKLQIEDTIFWIGFSTLLLLVSIFPQLIYWSASLLGIQSPTNMVFLVVIFTLVVRLFSQTMRISALDEKVKRMAQETALHKLDSESGEAEKSK